MKQHDKGNDNKNDNTNDNNNGNRNEITMIIKTMKDDNTNDT